MKAYRVENQKTRRGIWRDFDGHVSPVFRSLTHGKCKDIPMEDNCLYRMGGYQWFAATDTPDKLKAWFSAVDVFELIKYGYAIYEFEIPICHIVSDYEICFPREYIISQKIIDPRDIWGDEYKQLEELEEIIQNADQYTEKASECAASVFIKGYRKQKEGENVAMYPSSAFECSECHWQDWDLYTADSGYNYCPNCGAKMRGENK